jgi:hypothetical protein
MRFLWRRASCEAQAAIPPGRRVLPRGERPGANARCSYVDTTSPDQLRRPDVRSAPRDRRHVESGHPYREPPADRVHRCPFCEVTIAARRLGVCPRCGLWWVLPGKRARWIVPASASPDDSPALHLRLRSAVGPSVFVVLFTFAAVDYGAAGVLWASRDGTSGPGARARMLVGLGLALLVACFCTLCLAQLALHFLLPARLDGDESSLRVRLWNTWEGLLAGFRRIDVTVPREEVAGVVTTAGQGGDAQLFLVHRSGIAFGTGCSRAGADANRLGAPIARWLASPSVTPSPGSSSSGSPEKTHPRERTSGDRRTTLSSPVRSMRTSRG